MLTFGYFLAKTADLLAPAIKRASATDTDGNVYGANVTPGIQFASQSVASLSAGQAAGTALVLAASPNRSALKIVPPADCLLRLASGGSGVGGIPLFGGVPNEFSGQDCPTGALYITGLTAGAALTIWEG